MLEPLYLLFKIHNSNSLKLECTDFNFFCLWLNYTGVLLYREHSGINAITAISSVNHLQLWFHSIYIIHNMKKTVAIGGYKNFTAQRTQTAR